MIVDAPKRLDSIDHAHTRQVTIPLDKVDNNLGSRGNLESAPQEPIAFLAPALNEVNITEI